MKLNRNQIFLRLSSILILFLTSCFGSSSLVEDPLPIEDSAGAIIDAYFEYPGPNKKWSGPQNFVVHLSTISGPKARLSFSPQVPEGYKIKGGANLSTDEARKELSKLRASLQNPGQLLPSCLLPIRIIVIFENGSVAERQGCRGQAGWPQVVSEITHRLIEFETGQEKKIQNNLTRMPAKVP